MAQPQTSMTEYPARGLPGQFADMHGNDIDSYVNAEGSVSITPGRFVRKGTNADDAVLPTLAAHITGGLAIGFAVFQDLNISNTVLTNVDRAKYPPKAYFPVAQRSRGGMWIPCPKAFTKGGKVYVRFLATDPTYPDIGTIHPDVGSYDPGGGAANHCAELTFARFKTAGSAGDLALVEFDILPTG